MGRDKSQFNVSLIVRDKVTNKAVSTDPNFWRERRAEVDSNRGPSAYQPNALPLGQTGSQVVIDNVALGIVAPPLPPTRRRARARAHTYTHTHTHTHTHKHARTHAGTHTLTHWSRYKSSPVSFQFNVCHHYRITKDMSSAHCWDAFRVRAVSIHSSCIVTPSLFPPSSSSFLPEPIILVRNGCAAKAGAVSMDYLIKTTRVVFLSSPLLN